MIFDPSIELLVHMCFVDAAERREACAVFAASHLHNVQRIIANDPALPLFIGVEAAAAKLRAEAERPGVAPVAPALIEVRFSGPRFALLRGKQALVQAGGLQAVAEGRSLADLIDRIHYAMTSDGRTVGMLMLTLARIHRHKPSWASVRRTAGLLAEYRKIGVACRPNARYAEFGTKRNQLLAWSRFKGVAPLWAGLFSVTFGQRSVHEVAPADFVNEIFDQLSDNDRLNLVLSQANWFADFAADLTPTRATQAVLPVAAIDFFCTLSAPKEPVLAPLSEFEIQFLTNYIVDPN